MRPFGCPVTILNTIDHLGKFDGQAEEGFFVGYSTNSKAFRVFNNRTRIVKENLHVKFSENTPNIIGSGPNWLFDIDALTKSMNYEIVVVGNQSNGSVGTKECNDAGKARMEIEPGKDYILLPFLTQDPSFSSSSKDSPDTGFKPSREEEKKDAKDLENEDSEVPNTEEPRVNQKQDTNVNNTNNINIVNLTINAADLENNTADENIVYGCDDVPNMPYLEEIFYSDDDEGVGAKAGMTNLDIHILVSPTPSTIIHKDHPLEQIIGDIHSAPQTRRMTNNVIQALQDPSWIEAMQEELLQFKLQQVWTLMDLPHGKRAIGTKWVYRNKKDERGIVIRNKASLCLIQRLCCVSMDVKSAFLYGKIKEEVYVRQPLGFEDPEFPDKVYKIASTPTETSKPLLKDAEAEDVDVLLYRSMIGSFMYLTASRPDIMFAVCACARFQVTPKVLHLHAMKRIFRYLKGQPKLGLWYPKDSTFDLEAYTDSDYAGASLDRKSTIGGCKSLERRLISWQCKKQTIIANSTTEAEYVAASSCCGQVLWNQNQMLDYGYNFMNTKIFIDNESTICIVKNLVFHSKTTHIEIRHHFIRDSYEKKLNQVIKIHIDQNVADLLTKAFDVNKFQYLIATDETVIKEWEDRMERAATTAFSLEAEQDSGNINTTKSMATLNESFLQETYSGSSPRYALTVNPTIYTSCIKQFWATAKVQTINKEVQIQALVDGKKMIVTETSVRRALHLKDAKGTDCLPTATIFVELDRMGAKITAWNEFSSTMAFAIICLATNQIFNFSKYIFDNMVKNLEGGVKFLMYPRFVQVFLDKQVEDMSKHKEIYVTPSHTKNIFTNMKREGKGFSGRITPLFQTMMVQAPEELRRKQRKDNGPTKPITDEATNEGHVSTPSYDPSQSGEDIIQLNELMDLCAKLSNRVLALENTNTSQAAEIATLKERVKKLENKRRSRTYKLRRLYKGRKIADLDADTDVTLIDETQGRNDEDLRFDTGVLNGDEVFQEPMVNTATTTSLILVSAADLVTTTGEIVTTASVEILEELTLAQTLIEIKSAKPKAVTTATTVTLTSSRPKAKGIVFHD
ncbi:putative ribonuclease H-like domain-containing protein [Tanacetum coccineum]|uniref:Ribonuclease H-like domain-containing protein n=1 Tax=Tanacetum coccineum TaxID=301880 RepID=A0ABQ5FKW1_9ASTR